MTTFRQEKDRSSVGADSPVTTKNGLEDPAKNPFQTAQTDINTSTYLNPTAQQPVEGASLGFTIPNVLPQ